MPTIDRELYVISDLHIGGAYGDSDRGFRICTHTLELALYVRSLAAKPARPLVELVIAGDFVDFLAERWDESEPWRAFTSDGEAAAERLTLIVQRDREFFDALGSLLEAGHALTVLLGNHDIELSLPAVRERLLLEIGVRRNSRFRFIYDNEAYAVGEAVIEHGNRYDGFNAVDHDALRRLRSVQSRRLPLPAEHRFEPPPGSRLVASVMNRLKVDYPFIDLLKPEREAVLPLLLALEPGALRHVAEVLRLQREAGRHDPIEPAVPSYGSDIASQPQPDSRGTELTDEELLDESLAACMPGEERSRFIEAILQESGYASEQGDITAGRWSRAAGLARFFKWPEKRRARRLSLLLRALRTLQNDRSFDRDGPVEKPYLDAAEELAGRGFSVVIFGHTHLARDIGLTDGRGRYLNTGTWADRIEFPGEILALPHDDALSALEQFVHDIHARRFERWLSFDPTYARLVIDADGRVVEQRIESFQPRSH